MDILRKEYRFKSFSCLEPLYDSGSWKQPTKEEAEMIIEANKRETKGELNPLIFIFTFLILFAGTGVFFLSQYLKAFATIVYIASAPVFIVLLIGLILAIVSTKSYKKKIESKSFEVLDNLKILNYSIKTKGRKKFINQYSFIIRDGSTEYKILDYHGEIRENEDQTVMTVDNAILVKVNVTAGAFNRGYEPRVRLYLINN